MRKVTRKPRKPFARMVFEMTAPPRFLAFLAWLARAVLGPSQIFRGGL